MTENHDASNADEGEFVSSDLPDDGTITPGQALAVVDAILDRLRLQSVSNELVTVQGRLWEGFVEAAGLASQTVGGGPEVEYRSHKLRPSSTW